MKHYGGGHIVYHTYLPLCVWGGPENSSRLLAYLQVWWIFIPLACRSFAAACLCIFIIMPPSSPPLPQEGAAVWILCLFCGSLLHLYLWFCLFFFIMATLLFIVPVFIFDSLALSLSSLGHLFIFVSCFRRCVVGAFININEFCSMKVKLKFTWAPFKGATSTPSPFNWLCVCGLHDENLLKLLDLCISAVIMTSLLLCRLRAHSISSTHRSLSFSLWLHLILISKCGTSFFAGCEKFVCLSACLPFVWPYHLSKNKNKKKRKRIPQIEYLHKFIETGTVKLAAPWGLPLAPLLWDDCLNWCVR